MPKKVSLRAEPLPWESMKDDDSRRIETLLREAGFERVDAYRFNSASVRVRVIDPRFEEMPVPEREDMVFPVIERLPERIREDILLLLTMAPSELKGRNRHLLVNLEFESPLPTVR